jgi:hypothetical protein
LAAITDRFRTLPPVVLAAIMESFLTLPFVPVAAIMDRFHTLLPVILATIMDRFSHPSSYQKWFPKIPQRSLVVTQSIANSE